MAMSTTRRRQMVRRSGPPTDAGARLAPALPRAAALDNCLAPPVRVCHETEPGRDHDPSDESENREVGARERQAVRRIATRSTRSTGTEGSVRWAIGRAVTAIRVVSVGTLRIRWSSSQSGLSGSGHSGGSSRREPARESRPRSRRGPRQRQPAPPQAGRRFPAPCGCCTEHPPANRRCRRRCTRHRLGAAARTRHRPDPRRNRAEPEGPCRLALQRSSRWWTQMRCRRCTPSSVSIASSIGLPRPVTEITFTTPE